MSSSDGFNLIDGSVIEPIDMFAAVWIAFFSLSNFIGCEAFVPSPNRSLLILPLFLQMCYRRVRTYVPYHQQTAAIQFVCWHDFLLMFCTEKLNLLGGYINRFQVSMILPSLPLDYRPVPFPKHFSLNLNVF